MSELPKGWSSFTLSDIGGTVGGKTPSKSNAAFWSSRDFHWTSPKDMKSFRLTNSEDMISKAAVTNGGMRVLPKGSVLVVTRSGILAHTLPVAITDIETTINQDIKAIPPNDVVEPRYLAYLLRSKQREILENCSKEGTTVASVQTELLERLPLPLAPLAEQKRIADKLDRLLAAVDTCKARLDAIPAILKRFRQSVLAAATSGELTKEWRKSTQGHVKRIWREAVLEEICHAHRPITYGVIKLGKETSNGVPCLRTSNVRWLSIQLDGLKRIAPVLSNEFGRTVLQGSEVLVNVRGTLGGVAPVASDMRGWNVSREVAVVPVDEGQAECRFVAIWIAAEQSQGWLRKVQKGVAYTGINIADLRTLPIEMPSLNEQIELVSRVDMLFAAADRLEATVARSRERVEHLPATIFARAFRGELAPREESQVEVSRQAFSGSPRITRTTGRVKLQRAS